MKHFMIDYLELTMRRVARENVLFCAKKVGYFNTNQDSSSSYLAKLDEKFELCLGKFSDSYDSSLEVFMKHLEQERQQRNISHSTALDSNIERQNRAFLMGHG